jgi:hypothetical protein
MKYKDPKVLNVVQISARRKLEEVRDMLVPDTKSAEELSAEELAAGIGEQLRSLPREQQSRLWLKTAIAVAELDGLQTALAEHRQSVADELQKLSAHSTAVAAYRQRQRVPSKKAGGR